MNRMENEPTVVVALDPDLVAYAALQGRQRFSDRLAPRDTTYDPYDAAYEACEHAIKTYFAQMVMRATFAASTATPESEKP